MLKKWEAVEHPAAVFLMLGNSDVVIIGLNGSDLENVYNHDNITKLYYNLDLVKRIQPAK